MVNRELQKVRLKSDRKFHDGIVKYIFDNPASLNIEGLDSDTLIWKALEYHYMHGRGHKKEGQYELLPAPDLVFFYAASGFHFLVLEVKGNILGRSHVDAERQLSRAESYFRGFWKAVIVNQVKPVLLNRLDEFPFTDVLLSLAEVTKESLVPVYTVMPYKTGIYLGKARGSYNTNHVHFAE
ncbi:hypothetical protein ACFLWI_08230 [Chloroflexota bacterium]